MGDIRDDSHVASIESQPREECPRPAFEDARLDKRLSSTGALRGPEQSPFDVRPSTKMPSVQMFPRPVLSPAAYATPAASPRSYRSSPSRTSIGMRPFCPAGEKARRSLLRGLRSADRRRRCISSPGPAFTSTHHSPAIRAAWICFRRRYRARHVEADDLQRPARHVRRSGCTCSSRPWKGCRSAARPPRYQVWWN